MNEIKFKYEYKDNIYYLIENMSYDDSFSYPLFNAKVIKRINNIDILDYPLTAIRTFLSNEDKLKSIEDKYLRGKSSRYIKKYEFKDYIYLVFLDRKIKPSKDKNLSIFPKGLREFNDLGCFYLDENLINEILEIDQNLQSAISIDLILELMYENKDMNKYIPLIKEEINDKHLETCFFFDDFVYELFARVYIEVMLDNKLLILDELLKNI